jgi:glycosyltransferase involved in cell wall biosynthesis
MLRKILIFTDRFPYGRSESFFEEEIKYICNSFPTVIIMPFERGTIPEIRNLPQNAIVLNPPYNNSKSKAEIIIKGIFNSSQLIPFILEGFPGGAWKSGNRLQIWLTHVLVTRRLISVIRNKDLTKLLSDIDIAYFYWGLRWSQIIPFLPEDLSPQIAVRFHGSDLYEHLNSGYIPWRKQQINRINSCIAVSEAGKNYLLTRYGIPPEKIFLSRIGTPDCGINPYEKSDVVRIVSCSNIVPVKRVELIAIALKNLNIKIEWIHFGEGPLKKKVLQSASRLPENISWRLAGELKHDELYNFYRNVSIDLFINVSSSEGVPVSVMEALSFGIPVIATDAGGISEIVSEKCGKIIPVNFQPEFLAETIKTLIKSDNYMELRKGARQVWEEKCREDKVYPEFIEHLKKL